MAPSQSVAHQRLAIEAELAAGDCRFVRERLRLPMGIEASFGWLRHPPTVMVVPALADGRVLVTRRYHPAVSRWVLEFPSGTLQTLESPAAGGARVVRACSGHGAAGWRPLGSLRPNPGYSDELMTVGWMVVDATAANGATETEEASSTARLWSAQTLERALTSLDEAVDGRSVSAWFLARQRGWL